MEKFIYIITAVIGISLLSLHGCNLNENEANAEYKSYCELVSMWEEDTERGIEPTKRDGHPNYKGISCEL